MYLGDTLVFEKDKKVFEEVYNNSSQQYVTYSGDCAYIASSTAPYQRVITYYVEGYDYVDASFSNGEVSNTYSVLAYACTNTIPTTSNDGTCLIGSSLQDIWYIMYDNNKYYSHDLPYHLLIPIPKDYPYLSITYNPVHDTIQAFPVMSSEIIAESVELPDEVSLTSRTVNSAFEYLGSASGGWQSVDHTGTDILCYDFSNYNGYTNLSIQIEATTDGYSSYGNTGNGAGGASHTIINGSDTYNVLFCKYVYDNFSIVTKTGTTPIFICQKLIE